MVWSGSVSVPKHPDLVLDLRGPKQDQLSSANLVFDSFVDPEWLPLHCVNGPQLDVYTSSSTTRDYLGRVKALGLGLLLLAKGATRFDHVLLYFHTDENNIVTANARTLLLSQPPLALKLDSSQPNSQQEKVASRKANATKERLEAVVLGALRLRGIERSHPQFQQLADLCNSCCAFAFQHTTPTPEEMRAKVEAALCLLEQGLAPDQSIS